MLYAQQEVMVRDLHEYDFELQSQADLPDHPLVGEEVTFDAVIVSYPKNSGLASITSAGVPGRIHLFVTDVNAITEGEEGMSIQIVVEGAQRTTLEGLFRGDVIRVTGDLGFFGNVSQFDASDVELLGNITDGYEDLEPLLEPTTMSLTDLNRETEQEGVHEWISENYTSNIHRYVKFEGLEVIDRLIADNGRPWFILSDGNTILTSNDTSLRFRNDRGLGYAYDPEEDEGLGYNWRRLDESLDGPFQPPAPGSIVDISGFVVVNTFDPGGFDESSAQSTLKIAPWDDGVVWQNDGVDPADRLTPEGWPNDLVVQGFAPILNNFSVTSSDQVLNDDQVTVSVDVLLPEVDYTLESVEIEYMAYPYTEDEGTLVTEAMTSDGGDSYSFTFDAQADFTTVNFEVIATASTPDAVVTTARETGTFFVESATQTSPVVMTPAAGTFINQVSVSLSSATDGAVIYYTTNGDDPDETSEVYTSEISIEENTTVKAIAIADGLDNSPITSRSYSINVSITEVSTLADLRAGAQDGTTYQYTGSAVVTYARNSRNQKYLMDSSGGILIDDPNGNITSDYTSGDVMTDVIGTLGSFGGIVQFVPSSNPGDPQSTTDVVPLSLTLADVNLDQYESMLVEIEDVSFVESGIFEGGENYNLVDGSLSAEETVTFRTNFSESDYIGQDIPSGVLNLTAIVGGFNGSLQLISRSSADFGPPTSNENDINPYTFDLSQNYPNPFNPSTQINYSLAQTADVQLVVYDILGRRVASLVNAVQNAGTYSVNFDMSQFSSGTYIYRLEAGDFVSVRKMMLIK
jgi:hypothetical protein